MFGLLDAVKMAGASAATIAAATLYVAIFHDPAVRAETRLLVAAEARERAFDLLEQRNRDNEEISNFDLAALCRELGGEWVFADGRCD